MSERLSNLAESIINETLRWRRYAEIRYAMIAEDRAQTDEKSQLVLQEVAYDLKRSRVIGLIGSCSYLIGTFDSASFAQDPGLALFMSGIAFLPASGLGLIAQFGLGVRDNMANKDK